MSRVAYILLVVLLVIPCLSNAGTIDVLIKGVDDGVKTNKQQDYNEAVMNAKLQAIERAGVEIQSITQVVNFQTKFDMVESKAKAILLPGFQIMDMGYQTDGTYQVVLSGKVAVGIGKPQKRPKSLLNMATSEEIKGNKHYSEQRYEEGKAHYKKAVQLYNNILKSFPGSDEALKIEKESIIENLESKTLGIIYDSRTGLEWYVGPDKGTTSDEAKSWVENLNVGGGGWRMPTTPELKGLYKKGVGTRNMEPAFRTTGWCVWSGEYEIIRAGKIGVRYFDFLNGFSSVQHPNGNTLSRAFAVRLRR